MWGRDKLDQAGGLVAEFRSEITQLGAELGGGGGIGTEPAVELLERVVVDQIELDVFVAAAFACLYVGLAEEIQLGALFLGDQRRCGFLGVRFCRRRGARFFRLRYGGFSCRRRLGQTCDADCEK